MPVPESWSTRVLPDSSLTAPSKRPPPRIEDAVVVRGCQGEIGTIRRPRGDLQNACRGPGGTDRQRACQREPTQYFPLTSQNDVPPYKIGTPSSKRKPEGNVPLPLRDDFEKRTEIIHVYLDIYKTNNYFSNLII